MQTQKVWYTSVQKNEDLLKAFSKPFGNAQILCKIATYSRQECSSVFSADSGQGEPTDITDNNILDAMPTLHHHIKHHYFVLSISIDTRGYRVVKGLTHTGTTKHDANSV